jgi:hypothetical protein
MKLVAHVKGMGFETNITLPSGCAGFVQVAAFREAQLLRHSDPVPVE